VAVPRETRPNSHEFGYAQLQSSQVRPNISHCFLPNKGMHWATVVWFIVSAKDTASHANESFGAKVVGTLRVP
jgi:hypothetical protein